MNDNNPRDDSIDEATDDLNSAQCQACHSDVQPYTQQQAQQQLQQQAPLLDEWQIQQFDGVCQLWRSYRFKNFVTALAFTNRVGEMAEQQGHHPDLLTRWGAVEVTWWSHSIKGLHRNDFICAAKAEQLYHG